MMILTTNKSRYEELKKNPLLFLHKIEKKRSTKCDFVREVSWEAVNSNCHVIVCDAQLISNYLSHELIVVDGIKEDFEQLNPIEVAFAAHAIDASNPSDWKIAIDSFISRRSQNENDKFAYIHLLWMLNYRHWSTETIKNVLVGYSVQIRLCIISELCRISRCLSFNKQKIIREALTHFGVDYKIYFPQALFEPIQYVVPTLYNYNVFNLIDILLENEYMVNSVPETENLKDNPYLSLYKWIHNSEIKIDYSALPFLYSLSSHKIKMEIVKRYFHDIRIKNVSFDEKVLEQFIDGYFSDFIRYRHCLLSPCEPQNLSVPLLCDCVLTLYRSGGQTFQKYMGVLDFVITHCDVVSPSVILGLDEFIPSCDGGVVINPDFYGFVDYALVCELDEDKFTQENLLETIREMLKEYPHPKYYVCKNDEERKPLSYEQLQSCLKDCECKHLCEEIGDSFTNNCYLECSYEKKWNVGKEDLERVNVFLKNPISLTNGETADQGVFTIDLEEISTERMSNHIRSLVAKCENAGNGRFVIGSKNDVIMKFSTPISMRIIPRNRTCLGIEFDFFGIKEDLLAAYYNVSSDFIVNEFVNRESTILRTAVVNSLKEELKIQDFNGAYFEMPYNENELDRLLGLFHFRSVGNENPQFWKKQNIRNYRQFCAPVFANTYEKATALPFFLV